MTRINAQDEITEIPLDEEMGNSHDTTPILEREAWSSSSSAYSLEAVLNEFPLENDIGAHSMALPDLDDFTPRPRDIRRYGFSPPAETVILPPRRRFSSLWNPPVLSSLRRSIGLPSQENPVRAEAYEPNQAQKQARAPQEPREPRKYNLPTMSPIESQTLHHPYYTQEEPTLPPAPPTTPSRHHSRRDRYPPAPEGLYPIMLPHAVPSDINRRGEDNFSNMLPVRVYAPTPHPPPPSTPSHYRHHHSPPPPPCPTLESPSQSRFSVDNDEQRDIIGHFSLIRSRSRNRSICAACDEGGLGSGELECTCSFSLRVWVRTKIKRLDKKLKNAEGGRYSKKDNKRSSTRETRTNNQKMKEETPRLVPPPPPNTPASDENSNLRDFGPKRASNQKDLEGVSGRKIKRAKVMSERINLQQPVETEPTLCDRDERRTPSVLMSGQERQAEEPGKWLGKWKKGVRKVIIVSKASGVYDKK